MRRREFITSLANMSHELHTPLNAILGYTVLSCQYAAKAGVSGGPNKWRAPSGLSVFGRRAVQGDGAKRMPRGLAR